MKAVIPVAGTGTHLRPLTYTQPKPLILVAGKPIISFIIDNLIDIGIKEYVFITGYLGEKIREYVTSAYPHIRSEFVEQTHREGSGHAIWTAKKNIENEKELIIVFGDTIIDFDATQVLKTNNSVLCIKKVTNPCNFGIVELNENQSVKRLIEKPAIPKSNLAMVGFYKITNVPLLLEGLDNLIAKNLRNEGEFPLTDALQYMVEKGEKFKTITVNSWYDCGKKEILLETNAMLLEKGGYASLDIPNYDNTIFVHPVSVGANCKIKNSIIGPHVTIGHDVHIKSSIVKNTIVGNFTSLNEVVLQASVIGNDTSITGPRQSLNIGDNTEIDFR